MRTSNEVLISNGDMSGNLNGPAILINQVYCFMIQAVVSSASSISGSFKIQISADTCHNPQPNTVSNWTDYPSSTEVVSGNGSFVWDVTVTGGNWVRLVWTSTSGSATVNAIMNSKGV